MKLLFDTLVLRCRTDLFVRDHFAMDMDLGDIGIGGIDDAGDALGLERLPGVDVLLELGDIGGDVDVGIEDGVSLAITGSGIDLYIGCLGVERGLDLLGRDPGAISGACNSAK